MSKQPPNQTIRKRLENWVLPRLFPDHVKEVDRMVGIFEDAYQRGGLLMPPQVIIQKLRENGQLIDLIMRLRGAANANVFGGAYGVRFTDQDRIRAIQEARYLNDTDVNIEGAINMWTDFGLGKRVSVRSAVDDTAVDTILKDFFNDPKNLPIIGQDNVQELSKDALNEGELLAIFWFSPLDGKATIRTIPTDQIGVVWEDATNKKVPILFSHNTDKGTFYYRDWRASDRAVETAVMDLPKGAILTWEGAGDTIEINGRQEGATKAIALWKVRNRTNGRGKPQFYNGAPWADELNTLIGARSAVAQQAAAYAEKVIVKGGSRAVNDLKSGLQSSLATGNEWIERNPAPAPASTWIENENATREWMNRDTGASSARFDVRAVAGQVSVNTRIPLHWMGFPDALNNRATGREVLLPWIAQIGRYQLWFSSFFEEMGQIVLSLREQYGGMTFADKSIAVSLDAPTLIESEFILALMGQITTATEKTVIPYEAGTAAMKELVILALTAVGVRDAQEIYSTVGTTPAAEALDQIVDKLVSGKIKPQTAVDHLKEFYSIASNGNH